MSLAELMALVEQLRAQLGQGSTDPNEDLSNKSESELQEMVTDLQSKLGSAAGSETEEEVGEPFPEDFEPDLSKAATAEIASVLDLIGAKIQVEVDSEEGDGNGEKEKIVYQSPFSEEPGEIASYLSLLMEVLTTDTSEKIVGRVNINQASAAVLQGIPGITPETVDQILTSRQPDPIQADVTRRYATWILSEGLVTLDQMKQLMPYVTGAGSVYRVQVVGYFDRGGPAVRVEAVLDATTSPARLRSFRDLSHLGRGYGLETLGTESAGL